MTIPSLIDKQDAFEVIRDKIAQILADETVAQQALAVTAGKPDPTLWKLRVFSERSNAWEQFLATPVVDQSPIVNVWFDTSTFPEDKGNVINRQMAQSLFKVDCYGYGESGDDGAGGQIPGDREAAYVSHRALRLVRNILMSSVYMRLDLTPGFIGKRWPQSRQTFQPEQNGQTVENIVGSRLTLRVDHNEFAPVGDESNTLELVSVDIKRTLDGQVLAEADYPYPLP